MVLVALEKVPLAPVAGAVKVTLTPETGLLLPFFTVTASALAKAVEGAVVCGVVPALAVIEFAVTVMLFDVPVIEEVVVSVAVMVWVPPVASVAENVRTPLVNVESAGSVANMSLELK